VQTA
jgi:molecular chaperone DnaJ